MNRKMGSRVLVVLADGAEEMEVVIVVDVLRRAGLEVLLAGLDGNAPVHCSRAVKVVPDLSLEDVLRGPLDFAAIVLPGGAEGSRRLAEDPRVGALLREQVASSQVVAAICAAPMALVQHGIGKGAAMTSHPSVQQVVAAHASYRTDAVVTDGLLMTSRGPGTAFEFALALVTRLLGPEPSNALRAAMML